MNKLTKLSLIAMILTSGAMAESENLPNVIESGVVVNINRDMVLDACFVKNYGTITTQQTEGNYPTLSGSGSIINVIQEKTEETNDSTITSNNALPGISSFKKVTKTIGTVNENILLDGVTVTCDNDALDLSSETAETLVYLGSDTEGQEVNISYGGGCALGDSGGAYGVTINLIESFACTGSLEKLVKSKFVVIGDNKEIFLDPSGIVFADFEMSDNENGHVQIMSGGYYGKLTFAKGSVYFSSGTMLKSGATLTIGAAPDPE